MGHQRRAVRGIALLIATMLSSACSKDAPPPAQRALPPPPPPAPIVERFEPTLANALADRTREPLLVTVSQVIERPSYAYLSVTDGATNGWIIAPAMTVPLNSELTVEHYIRALDFEALEIDRRFDVVLLAARVNGAGVRLKETGEEAAVDPVLPASGVTQVQVSIRRVKVARADVVIAELRAQRADLTDRRIKLRGQVIRVVPRVRDRNWVWLRDASADGDFGSLPVVLDRAVEIGQVLLVEGRVSINRKFRIGGVHPVLLEDAVVLAVESAALLPAEEEVEIPGPPTALMAPAWVNEAANPSTTMAP